MLTQITGTLTRVLDDRVRLQVGPLEYEVLVPELVRRQLQKHVDETATLHTSHYLEGNPMQGRMVPRLIGFLHEAELEFFELFCTVDKVGVRKALKALTRPIRDIADAIQREDTDALTDLPGVGKATAEQIVATLKRKVVKFALMVPTGEATAEPPATADQVAADAVTALIQIGHSPGEARDRVQKAIAGGKKFATAEDVLFAIYQQGA